MKVTLSVIKADVGGIGGHTRPSDGLLNAIRKTVKNNEKLQRFMVFSIVISP